jgi:hypothetical protein
MRLAIYHNPKLGITTHTVSRPDSPLRQKLIDNGFVRLAEFKGHDISPIMSMNATKVLKFVKAMNSFLGN